MSSLRELKKKIATINKIKKIFLVMKSIASSKMKKAQDNVNLSNKTIDLIKQMFFYALKNSSDPLKILSGLEIIAKNPEAPVLYLLISSDKGLCGNYNNLVLRKINSIIKEKNDYKIAFAGKKVKNIFSSKIDSKKIIQDLSQFNFNDLINDPDKVSIVLDKIFELFNNGEISDCQIIYVFSENVMSRKAKISSLFDFSDFDLALQNLILRKEPALCRHFDKGDEDDDLSIAMENKTNVIFEPEELEILKTMKNFYFRAKFFNFFRNAHFSELASRMIAMDNANRNSSELGKKMTLKYNKKRQENITKELIDIVNGSENV